MKTRFKSSSCRRVFVLALVAVAGGAGLAIDAQGTGSAGVGAEVETIAESPEASAMDWREVEKLKSEQKYQAALDLVGEMVAATREAGDADGWTRALIEAAQLRTALHGYETAVRDLAGAQWPNHPRSRAVLGLFYARSLVVYAHAYSWEIRSRERVDTGDEVDLKRWTLDRIVEEANRALLEVWVQRQEWGGESIGDLARYIAQNNYPARIRGSLRDAVTYMWVELLADTSLWRPDHSNELFRLDVAVLLGGDPERAAVLDLGDPRIHPLLKTVALLDDLETWHREQRRPEAAFEARLERLRRLRASFTQTEDRLLIRSDLEDHLDTLGRDFEWWSMGQAHLAEFVRDEDQPDALVRAREIAREGIEAHPDSPGGQRCRHIVASISAPGYSMQAMASDGLERRSIQVDHRNIRSLYFRAYRIDLLPMIEKAEDYNLFPDHREVGDIVRGRQPAIEWDVKLPPTPDYRSHVTFVTPPLERAGAYLVVASMRGDFAEHGNQMVGVNAILGDLVLLTREIERGWEITVRSGASGDPVSGARVMLYRYDWQRGHRRVDEAATGGDGVVSFDQQGWERTQHFLVATRGVDIALDQSYLRQHADRRLDVRSAALVYTDRSVYRPLQNLHFKVVAYTGGGEDVRFRTLPDTDLVISLVDANGEEVAEESVSTNDFGSASGSFAIPAGRLLGRWRVRASLGGEAAVRVEEYKRPTFEVTVRDPEVPLRLNQPAKLGGDVTYYFGLPVTSGAVAWRVSREPVYPRWWSWWWPSPRTSSQIIATGEDTLDEDGTFEVAFTPEADEREAAQGVTYRFRLAVDVTDEGGETRSASRFIRLGFVAVEARVNSDVGFFREGEPMQLTIARTDLDGRPRQGVGQWRVVALKQPQRALLPADQPRLAPPSADGEDPYRTPGDRLRPRWSPGYDPEAIMARWDEGAERARGRAEHGEVGFQTVRVDGLSPGAFRFVYTTEDAFGATCRASRDFVVASTEGAPVALPFLVLVERPSVPVGGIARVLVRSGLADQELVLERFRDGRRVGRRVLRSGRDAELVEFPVGTEDRGGFGLTVSALRDHQLMHRSQSVAVAWEDRELKLEFASFRDLLRPGGRETFQVKVSSHDGSAVAAGAAEVLAYMYDRSLDIFAPHIPPQPLSLYPFRGGAPGVQSSLGVARQAWRHGSLPGAPGYLILVGDRLKALDGYGIGGPGRRMRRGLGAERMMTAAVPAPQAARMEETAMSADLEAAPAEGVAQASAADVAAEAPVELRTDFSETAFFEPHLLTAADGSVTIEFEVPDSVTEWNVWVHAITRDLRARSEMRRTRSVKELMVRPYLPRFLREGDRAELKVVVNNAGEEELDGTLDFEILDPDTDASVLDAFALAAAAAKGVGFTVEAGGGTTLVFPIRVPNRVGTVAFRVTARAGDFSDGELRPLPVLPGRMHLVQSRFVTLQDSDRRSMRFEDMARGDDPTLVHNQLVVTVDAQLFYSVLNALPYLVSYPYECTEQTLNRFLSTGIVSSLYDDYPAVARMAEQFSTRETRLETWEAVDPNRKMALEETPWLVTARGADDSPDELVNVLDPRIARAERDSAIAKLRKAQTSLGAFPWWPGGPPSPYMTVYILCGFSRGLEFGVDVPKDVVLRAWAYMHRQYVDELVRLMMDVGCCWERITFLNFVLSNYPDDSWTGGVFTKDDRQQMLDFSFRHWKQHSPLLKGYLALTLERAGRYDDAQLVFDSVMDSARTTRDEGTFWAPEDRAWLWYNDTIETHAFALRTLTELDPDDDRRHGLVHWLLLNKKLNHWKSTRATGEVLYSLVHYLEKEGTLGVREDATVTVGPIERTFVFEPDRYTGARNRVVVPGERVDPETMATVVVEKRSKGFAFASATWHFSTEELPAEARGDLFSVTRRYFRRFSQGDEWVLQPIEPGAELEPGDQVEVQLSIRAKHAAEYVHLRDPRGAGFEPETFTSRYRWDLGIGYYEEIRDSGTNFFFEWLPAGEYTFKYRLRAAVAGTFKVAPATLQSMYAPEFAAYSSGAALTISN